MPPDKKRRPGVNQGAKETGGSSTHGLVGSVTRRTGATAQLRTRHIFRTHAPALARAGLELFPLRGKWPLIKAVHPFGSRARSTCRGTCGQWGHGVLDATADPDTIAAWARRYPWANIGLRLPGDWFVLDVDPRNDGHQALAELEREHGALPLTLLVISGRGDGGRHGYWRHPGGELSARRLLHTGLDLKTRSGYVVLPPSLHPDTGRPYTWAGLPGPVDPPPWLVDLLRPAPPQPVVPKRRDRRVWPGESPGDWFNRVTSWTTLLDGWQCLDPDPDAPGARWRHPTATSRISATVGHDGRLYVYSTNVEWAEPTEPGHPRGHSRFDAYALLEHHGDHRAAARAIAARRKGAAA